MKKESHSEFNIDKFLARFLTYKFADDCLNMMKLAKDTGEGNVVYSFNFLVTNSLELFAKSFLCLKLEKEENLTKNEIENKLKRYGHNLSQLYSEEGVGSDFLFSAGINKVELDDQLPESKIKNYKFKFHTNKGLIFVYENESLRYGVLANENKQNNLIIYDIQKSIVLCEDVKTALLGVTKKYLK